MPRTFDELTFEPTIPELREMQAERKVTVLTGYNNSGKSAYLKKLSMDDRVLFLGPNRFYSFPYMGLFTYDANEVVNMRNNMVNQRSQQFSNFEGVFYDTNRALSRLTNDQRAKLFSVFTELFGSSVAVKPELEDNEFSNRYISIDGENLSVTSSGTRLFLGVLAALMDERFQVVALDEPELGMSPTLQARLARLVIGRERDEDLFAHNPHFFVTTHSHIFLDRDYPTSNFIVSRDGNVIKARRCEGQQELIDVQFRMLGNDLSLLFLPDAILFVEGETDRIFLHRLLQLELPDKKIVVEACGGDLAGRLHAWSAALGDIQVGPYRNRTFVVADAVMQSGLERVIGRLGIPHQSVIQWQQNGIEYLYPLDLLSSTFGSRIESYEELAVVDDRVTAHGITKTKMELAIAVTAGLTNSTVFPAELEEKLLSPMRRAILPD